MDPNALKQLVIKLLSHPVSKHILLTDPLGQQIVQALAQQEQQGAQGMGQQPGGAPQQGGVGSGQSQMGGSPQGQGMYGSSMGLSANPNAGGSNGTGGSEMMSPGMSQGM